MPYVHKPLTSEKGRAWALARWSKYVPTKPQCHPEREHGGLGLCVQCHGHASRQGFSPAEYLAKHQEQHGRCAVCSQPETRVHGRSRTGFPSPLIIRSKVSYPKDPRMSPVWNIKELVCKDCYLKAEGREKYTRYAFRKMVVETASDHTLQVD